MVKLFEEAIEKVKRSLHGYWVDKDTNNILSACENNQVYLIGVTNPNWEGSYILNSESYNVVPIDDTRCIVSARLALEKDKEEIIVDASFNCSKNDEGISFFYVHMTRIENGQSLLKDAFRNSTQLSDGKYRDVIHQVFDVVLEYSCLNNTFKYNHDEYRKLFEMDKYYINVDQWFWSFASECVHPEDGVHLDLFRESDIIKRVKLKQNMIETEFRVKNSKKGYIWVRMYVIIVPDEACNVVKEMYILFKNIDEAKTFSDGNQLVVRKDDVTSVWNRTYTESLIVQECADLSEKKHCALALIDIDNLKTINDIYGKMTGDYILRTIGDMLLEIKKPEDIVGRYYADSFALFISNRDELQRVDEFIKTIQAKTTFEYSENNINTKISCSIVMKHLNEGDNIKKVFEMCDGMIGKAKESDSGLVML